MKDKNVAGILALFFGSIGVHRFYLGQVGLGILYAVLLMTGVSFVLGLIDAIVFFSMDKEAFDLKYNREFYEVVRRERKGYDRPERRSYRQESRRTDYERRRSGQQRPTRRSTPKAPPKPRANPFRKSGVDKYKEYDYDGAIEDFEKALEINPNDIAVHFNLACAYSLNEVPEKSFFHLDRAVALGFNDFQKIKDHDALAYLRIQDEFETFEANGFRLKQPAQAQESEPKALPEKIGEEDLIESGGSELLEQLRKLNELRDKGLLTEEEFMVQKKKLMR